MGASLMLVVSLLVGLLGSVIAKYYTAHARGARSSFLFSAVNCAVAALLLLLFGGVGTPSLFTLLLGALFGALTALQGVMSLTSLRHGPMSYTAVIVSFSTLMPALSGVLFFEEKAGWVQAVGIGLMLVSFLLAVKTGKEEKKVNFTWLLFCTITFLATGSIGILQKVHQNTVYKGESDEFLIVSFIVSALLCALFALFWRDKKANERDKTPLKQKKRWLFPLLMIVSGVTVALNNRFNLYLSGVMDSALFFPVINCGGLVLSSLAAAVLFRERLTPRQWLGVAIGILSVVFLCDPFSS